ncbi:hypothetical protein JAAARDRAFT_37885 [Jaapia argillacea MUCL 33604]|uniref:Mitochondrial import inner membrane translocase subunit Tim21 n=1 Tax=Jaapia argillacea MUCL 33604 TaxID=933084 RepID=A0A067PU18_9AGAM|nr:hypothetical protein JAAARDRAFT_37885 [Jaapia argillacea MUCL 33604]
MNVQRLHLQLLFREARPISLVVRCSPHASRPWIAHKSRGFATHRDPVVPSSILTHALDQKQRGARRQDSVGPFQLGLVPPTEDEVKNLKKWSELSAGGKVARATAWTTNLTVILFGAGLSALLIYTLTSELFSRNSPTVLYGEACEKIKESPRVAKYFQKPLTFHNNAPSAIRPRHRNHHVASQVAVDSAGREHMLLNFYVQGRPPGSAPAPDAPEESYLDSVVTWSKDKASRISELTWDECVSEAKSRTTLVVESSKRLFRYLIGRPERPTTSVPPPAPEATEKQAEKGGFWSIAGVFGGLKMGGPRDGSGEPAGGKMYAEGEIHADLVKNDKGYFEFRYILIDIPHSRTRNPVRVFVEKSSDVRDAETVMRWS